MKKRSRAHDIGSIDAGSIEADNRKAKRFLAFDTQPGRPGATRAAKSSKPGRPADSIEAGRQPNRASQGAQERTGQPNRASQGAQERPEQPNRASQGAQSSQIEPVEARSSQPGQARVLDVSPQPARVPDGQVASRARTCPRPRGYSSSTGIVEQFRYGYH